MVFVLYIFLLFILFLFIYFIIIIFLDSLLHFAGLAHKNRSSQVPVAFLRDPLRQLGRQVETLLPTRGLQDLTNLQEEKKR